MKAKYQCNKQHNNFMKRLKNFDSIGTHKIHMIPIMNNQFQVFQMHQLIYYHEFVKPII